MLGLPAQDWAKWNAQMLKSFIGELTADTKYSELERAGLGAANGDVTYVQQVAMPPDAFTNHPNGWIAQLKVEFANEADTKKWKANPTMAVPVAHYSTNSSRGWIMNSDIVGLRIKSKPQRWIQDVGTPLDLLSRETTVDAHRTAAPKF